jgi:hypothetical protein
MCGRLKSSTNMNPWNNRSASKIFRITLISIYWNSKKTTKTKKLKRKWYTRKTYSRRHGRHMKNKESNKLVLVKKYKPKRDKVWKMRGKSRSSRMKDLPRLSRTTLTNQSRYLTSISRVHLKDAVLKIFKNIWTLEYF